MNEPSIRTRGEAAMWAGVAEAVAGTLAPLIQPATKALTGSRSAWAGAMAADMAIEAFRQGGRRSMVEASTWGSTVEFALVRLVRIFEGPEPRISEIAVATQQAIATADALLVEYGRRRVTLWPDGCRQPREAEIVSRADADLWTGAAWPIAGAVGSPDGSASGARAADLVLAASRKAERTKVEAVMWGATIQLALRGLLKTTVGGSPTDPEIEFAVRDAIKTADALGREYRTRCARGKEVRDGRS